MATPSEPSAPSRKLGDVVTAKEGVLSPSDTLAKAGDQMRALNVDVLPVSEGRRLVGILDEKHPDRIAAGHGHDPQVEKIGDSMNRNLVYCFEDQDAAEARRIMDEAGLNILPVVDRQMRFVGMVRWEEVNEGQ